jgi:caffeoyl-CoA O-methyltransferase
MEFISKDIDTYSCQHTSPESPLLSELNRKTHLQVLQPRMLSGHLQGRFLSMLSHMIKPQRILEIGTYTGYSALCLAEGLRKDGELITIDVNDELESFCSHFFERYQGPGKILPLIGNALEIIPTLEGTFDIVFIDADKKNYLTYFELIQSKLSPGAYVLVDNVLWSGKVVDRTKHGDKETEAIHTFNKVVHEDERFENVLLPVRDGIMVLRKK